MREDAAEGARPGPAIETVLVPRTRDLGGVRVGRVLPAMQRRMVGPFVFLDELGPVLFRGGDGLDVAPHPHVGLATVTYLFEGELLHRDSLGSVQVIAPGAVNWMTAGRGIAHSERTPPAARAAGGTLSGIQSWVALPRAHEEDEPSFAHVAAEALPALEAGGVRVRVIAGTFAGARSPVRVLSETLYVDAALAAGARLEVPADQEERAALVASGELEVDGARFPSGQLLVLRRGAPVVLRAPSAARVLLLGGEPMDGERHVWWNFVSSSRERIEQAAADWRAGRFRSIPGERDPVPLPERPPGMRIR
ncbi:pirin family protein [Anaeromyxobacter dehalogenans]|uniref:Pirin-like protein n=1 Tax=Anaeromyxobacter dehalogenans (strain 2CP-C) TaxID=290397 RepID=Q2IF93_ANADE|nr:pirin family protein [Anaeromyxobacter dehalogenans]ABC83255.1 Pirin-like protein [Anaeromyxobacter dehalogenans 2CP-C]